MKEFNLDLPEKLSDLMAEAANAVSYLSEDNELLSNRSGLLCESEEGKAIKLSIPGAVVFRKFKYDTAYVSDKLNKTSKDRIFSLILGCNDSIAIAIFNLPNSRKNGVTGVAQEIEFLKEQGILKSLADVTDKKEAIEGLRLRSDILKVRGF